MSEFVDCRHDDIIGYLALNMNAERQKRAAKSILRKGETFD